MFERHGKVEDVIKALQQVPAGSVVTGNQLGNIAVYRPELSMGMINHVFIGWIDIDEQVQFHKVEEL